MDTNETWQNDDIDHNKVRGKQLIGIAEVHWSDRLRHIKLPLIAYLFCRDSRAYISKVKSKFIFNQRVLHRECNASFRMQRPCSYFI